MNSVGIIDIETVVMNKFWTVVAVVDDHCTCIGIFDSFCMLSNLFSKAVSNVPDCVVELPFSWAHMIIVQPEASHQS